MIEGEDEWVVRLKDAKEKSREDVGQFRCSEQRGGTKRGEMMER
jgi:hypothetical protein